MSATSTPSPRVRVVVPAWNSRRWLEGCLDALRGQDYRDFAITVVDSDSRDGTGELLGASYPEARLLRLRENRGFAAAVNAGIRAAREPLIALLNADTRPEPGWLGALVRALEEGGEELGSVASRMLRMDDPERIDDAGDGLSWYGTASKRGHGEPAELYDRPAEVLSACAGAALYRREMFDRVGLFDEGFESYLEDVDLGLRARHAGFRCRYEPGARVLHRGGGSGLSRRRYVALTTGNRLMLLAKNLPAGAILRHLRQLLWGQVYFLLVHRRPLASLAGYGRFLRRLGPVLRARRRILAGSTLERPALEALLGAELGEPSLRTLLRRKLVPRS